jgi:hypothetical protein
LSAPLHLPVLPPSLKAPEPGWKPKETFSPSAMVSYAGEGGCQRKYFLGAACGIREVKTGKSRALGSLIHAACEHYMRGGLLTDLIRPDGSLNIEKRLADELAAYTPEQLNDLAREAVKRAVPGILYLPLRDNDRPELIEVEQWISIPTNRIVGGIEPLRITGKIDLSFRRQGRWYLVDHKSTKGKQVKGSGFDPWFYCKSPDDLKTDPQGVFYALDRIYKHNLESLWSRWIYYSTAERAFPEAHCVDVELKRAELEPAAYQWLIVANDMRHMLRAAARGELRLEDIPAPIDRPFNADGTKNEKSPCNAFGGCPHRADKGGLCDAGGALSLGNVIANAAPVRQEENQMDAAEMIAKKVAEAQAANGTPPASILTPPEAHATPVPPPVAVAPTPQPGLQTLPAGYEWRLDPTGMSWVPTAVAVAPVLPVAVAVAPTPPPVVAAPPVPPVVAAPPVPPVAPVPPPVALETAPPAEAPKRGRGRPKKAAAGGQPPPDPILEAVASAEPVGVFVGEDLTELVLDAIFVGAKSDPALAAITVAQITSLRRVLDVAVVA